MPSSENADKDITLVDESSHLFRHLLDFRLFSGLPKETDIPEAIKIVKNRFYLAFIYLSETACDKSGKGSHVPAFRSIELAPSLRQGSWKIILALRVADS